MNEEITIEEADRIIKSANLVTLAQMVVQGVAPETRQFAESILKN